MSVVLDVVAETIEINTWSENSHNGDTVNWKTDKLDWTYLCIFEYVLERELFQYFAGKIREEKEAQDREAAEKKMMQFLGWN